MCFSRGLHNMCNEWTEFTYGRIVLGSRATFSPNHLHYYLRTSNQGWLVLPWSSMSHVHGKWKFAPLWQTARETFCIQLHGRIIIISLCSSSVLFFKFFCKSVLSDILIAAVLFEFWVAFISTAYMGKGLQKHWIECITVTVWNRVGVKLQCIY